MMREEVTVMDAIIAVSLMESSMLVSLNSHPNFFYGQLFLDRLPEAVIWCCCWPNGTACVLRVSAERSFKSSSLMMSLPVYPEVL
jgi:hypothetical protein